jgi:tetratricopeptide (TPR) repeat protein
VKWHSFATIKQWTRIEWLLAGVGCAFLLGCILPWYTMPSETLAAFGSSLWLPRVMRVIPAIGALIVALNLFGRSSARRRRLSCMLLWTALPIVLLFPFLVATFSPAVAYVAAAFDQQRENTAYHIETHYPETQSQWGQSIPIDPYGEIATYAPDGLTRGYVDPMQSLPNGRPFNVDSADFFQLSSWDRLVMEGMNFLPGFLASVHWGWPITVIAVITALITMYLVRPDAFFRDVRRILPWYVAGAFVVIVVLIGPCFVTRQISIWLARGEYERASWAAHLLSACYPPMEGDTPFMLQIAESDVHTGRTTVGVQPFAQGFECWRSNRLDLARTYFEQAVESSPHNYLFRGYLAATLVRIGAQLFEQNQPAAAANVFDLARHVFPNHLQATYFAMISRAAEGNFEQSMLAAQDLRTLQRNFRQPGLAAMGQSFVHEAWADYRAGKLQKAWHAYRQSVDVGTWE